MFSWFKQVTAPWDQQILKTVSEATASVMTMKKTRQPDSTLRPEDLVSEGFSQMDSLCVGEEPSNGLKGSRMPITGADSPELQGPGVSPNTTSMQTGLELHTGDGDLGT